jgi:nucleotide-binding universal stress UspA family protein
MKQIVVGVELGSDSRTVAQHATCPVAIIRQAES